MNVAVGFSPAILEYPRMEKEEKKNLKGAESLRRGR
jgi:hypothetical protein